MFNSIFAFAAADMSAHCRAAAEYYRAAEERTIFIANDAISQGRNIEGMMITTCFYANTPDLTGY